MLAQTLDLWRALAALTTGTAVVALLGELLLVVGLSFFVAWRRLKELRQGDAKRLDEQRKRLARDSQEAHFLLSSLDIGFLAFDVQNHLIFVNEQAKSFFPRVPETLEDFLSSYAPEAASSLLLGKKLSEQSYRNGERSFHMQLRQEDLAGAPLQGTVILVRDITLQEREEEQRKRFVANVSHELRTPLTTIETYSETLLDWGIKEKSREQLLKDTERIYDNAKRMEKLIDDLLLLSSLDGRGLSTRVERLDLAWLVHQVTESMQAQAEAKHIRMTALTVSQIPEIYGDRSSLERIFTNLISNALKYTQERGEVTVSIGFLLEEVYVKVKDNGLGIDPEHQNEIFKRFYRVDKTGSRQRGGTGLGLSIVKELVDLHQGKISLRSALTQGSEFYVMLPAARKTLSNALFELTNEGICSNPMTAAAARDLEQLAEQLGIVARWKSLDGYDYKKLAAEIERVTRSSRTGG